MRKNYVLDSSILVFDPSAITAFKGNNVIIPNCEIKKLEKYTEDKRLIIRYQANDALNFIKNILSAKKINYTKGVAIPDTDIVLYILSSGNGKNISVGETEKEIMNVLKHVKSNLKSADSKQLKTILVSRVLSLRNAAIDAGLEAEDYMADRILADNMFNGITEVEYENECIRNLMDSMYLHNAEEMVCPANMNLIPNEFLVVKNSDGDVTAKFRYDATHGILRKLSDVRKKVYSIKPLNDCQEMAFNLLFDPKVKLISLIGGPGTGKTLISVASALQQVVPLDGSEPRYKKMIFIRPMVAAGEEMGFLPGDEMEKLKPWMGSFYDSIEKLRELALEKKKKCEEVKPKNKESDEPSVEEEAQKFIEDLIKRRKLEMMPTTYMRGRTFHDTIVIVDEAQGITPHVMKMILTRIGKNSKIIIAGDPSDNQIDTEVLASYFNGLVCASQKMVTSKYSGIVEFSVDDTERSNFVADVEKLM